MLGSVAILRCEIMKGFGECVWFQQQTGAWAFAFEPPLPFILEILCHFPDVLVGTAIETKG